MSHWIAAGPLFIVLWAVVIVLARASAKRQKPWHEMTEAEHILALEERAN